ncbi:growth/differentiation factor 5 [Platysternon megacephalum]|uniref:Growth/differentiation factor 5 n=1 Tax=Platysternon megacephalum TaxID=55544 RepID=A0A4D9E846_9SAUR|nr:growth/differentiation factor 5 [Platysternon megacephalum]
MTSPTDLTLPKLPLTSNGVSWFIFRLLRGYDFSCLLIFGDYVNGRVAILDSTEQPSSQVLQSFGKEISTDFNGHFCLSRLCPSQKTSDIILKTLNCMSSPIKFHGITHRSKGFQDFP